MRILAVDTCSRSCSVAVTDAGRLVGEVTTLRRQTHSRHLMRMVDMTLEIAGMALGEIDAFAVTRGPGSFTGLRIGISMVKGLALAAGKPAVGVSSLQALAWPLAFSSGRVCALLDAGKREVYGACYRFPVEAGWENVEERVLPPGDLLAGIAERCTFVGDGAQSYLSLITERLGEMARMADDDHHMVRAASVARLASFRLEQGAGNGPEALVPRYLRKSDAELSLGAKVRPRPQNGGTASFSLTMHRDFTIQK